MTHWIMKPDSVKKKGLTLIENTLMRIRFSVSLITFMSLHASDENVVLPCCNIFVYSLFFYKLNGLVPCPQEKQTTGRSHFMPGLCSWKTSCKFKLRKSNRKFTFKTVYFLGVRELTTLSCIVYDYTTSGCTNL
jgi:hypothetical protein